MLFPWLVTLLMYGVFGQSRYANRLPDDPREIARKTRAILKPEPTERNTMTDVKVRIKKFVKDHADEIVIAGTLTAGVVFTAITSYQYGVLKTEGALDITDLDVRVSDAGQPTDVVIHHANGSRRHFIRTPD